MAPVPVVELRELESCSSNIVYGDPKGSYLAAVILAAILAIMSVASISLFLIARQRKRKLQSTQRNALKYQAIVQTAQAEALESQHRAGKYQTENISLSKTLEQLQRHSVEFSGNHHSSTRASSSTKESAKHLQIVPPANWQKPGNSPLRQVEPVSPGEWWRSRKSVLNKMALIACPTSHPSFLAIPSKEVVSEETAIQDAPSSDTEISVAR
ncbi:hypothetical protein CEK26_001182 [Fusarium fujikuroi]|uniref:Uncharacterized protein n=1 Tax=Fusarium fujikuroi TaxID=5127 RepID=A0A5Q3EAS2_FUSFU|nr:hypothetical protein CEK27_001182 [Fusarium fujikuroi]QGI76271.1 hypothetical protein CEK25_001177 [Fusarium fujikuroi]QGI89967.1 hypothetical protein CEK26_001182 [Fusarium fujikuroi]VTT80574.1 unnamed protein product [Fusarium fujikuroi]VTT84307.1 unnamed protein product [Fusarium fujikuroi]